MKSMKFNPIDPYTTASLEWVDNSQTDLRFHVKNITADLHINMWVWIAHVFPMWGANFKSTNMNISIDLSFSDLYDVYPQIHIDPFLSADDLYYDFFYIGFAVRMFLDQDTLLRLVEGALTSAVKGLDESLRNP